MKTAMYIHGYGSDGNAVKGQLLRKMLSGWRVLAPTLDYDHSSPWKIQQQISDAVAENDVRMIVGSSFGGYHSLCAMSFFRGTLWAINPVHDAVGTISRIVLQKNTASQETKIFLDGYKDFNNRVFVPLSKRNREGGWPSDANINFALSTDDELLGDHSPLLQLFPVHNSVVWKDHSGHPFMRFNELHEDILKSVSLSC